MSISTDTLDHWAERVINADGRWFDRLTRSPLSIPIQEWPFSKEERDLLKSDLVLQKTVGAYLHERAKTRWLAMPDPEDVGLWLEGEDNPEIEALVRRFALAQESARHQANLYVETGLISKKTADAKLAHVSEKPWLRATVAFRAIAEALDEKSDALIQYAAALAHAIQMQQPQLASRATTPSSAIPDKDCWSDLAARLTADRSGVTFHPGMNRRVRLKLCDDALLIEPERDVGPLDAFVVELIADGQKVLSLAGEKGLVILPFESLNQAIAGGANELVITTTTTPSANS